MSNFVGENKRQHIFVNGHKISRGYVGNRQNFSDLLPIGFRELKYIESSGAQYIDTGIKPNQDTAISIKYSPLSVSAEAGVFGVFDNNKHFLMNIISASRTTARVQNKTFDGAFTHSIGSLYNCELDKSALKINGTNVYTFTNVQDFESNGNIWLFNRNPYNGTTTRRFFTGRIYGAKLSKSSTLLRNFIPAKAKAASKNLLNFRSFTSARTVSGVTFTPVFDGGSLAYISVSGTATANATVYIDGSIATLGVGTYSFGKSVSGVRLGTSIGSTYYNTESTRTITVTEASTTGRFYLQAISGSTFDDARIYPQLELGAETPYEPYYGANEAGFYDLVNHKFYTNAGTGNFVAGPEA